MVGILYLISYSLRLVSYILYILNIKYLIPGIIYIISYSLLAASSKPVTADSTALRTCWGLAQSPRLRISLHCLHIAGVTVEIQHFHKVVMFVLANVLNGIWRFGNLHELLACT